MNSSIDWPLFLSQLLLDGKMVVYLGGGTFLIALALASVFGFFVLVCSWFLSSLREHRWTAIGATIVFGLTAFIAGHITANSREAVVGDVAPVLLTGFGVLVGYAFIHNKVTPLAGCLSALIFTACFFFGTVLGGHHRTISEAWSALPPSPSQEVPQANDIGTGENAGDSGANEEAFRNSSALELVQPQGTPQPPAVIPNRRIPRPPSVPRPSAPRPVKPTSNGGVFR